MRKKKKKANKRSAVDARGYQQHQQPQPTTTTTTRTTTTPATATATATAKPKPKPVAAATTSTTSKQQEVQTVTVTTTVQKRLDELEEILLLNSETYNDYYYSSQNEGAENKNGSNSASRQQQGGGPSDRFYKRVSAIYDRSVELGFRLEQIERACGALGYKVTFEGVLDWLCSHSPTGQLPPLFTEGQVRDDLKSTATSAQNQTPTVLVAPTKKKSVGGGEEQEEERKIVVENTVPIMHSTNNKDNKKEDDKDEEAKAKQKAWLLQQYQYDDEEEEVDDDEHDQPRTATNDEVTVTENSQQKQQQPILSPLQLQLQRANGELECLEADANDQAANYMRSKYEIKELQKKLRQLKQQVNGLERKVQREEREKREQEAVVKGVTDGSNGNANNSVPGDNEEEEEEEEGMGLGFSLFGDNNDDEDDAETETTEPRTDEDTRTADVVMATVGPDSPSPKCSSATSSIEFPDDAVPISWTGKTPCVVLEEHCRKNQLNRPKYEKIAQGNGCRLRMNAETFVEQELSGCRASYQKIYYVYLKEYVATKMLYELRSDLPLYQLFPPFYGQLWKSWLQQDKEKIQLLNAATETERQANIEQLILLIKEKAKGSAVRTAATTTKGTRSDNPDEADDGEDSKNRDADDNADSWEGRAEDDDKAATSKGEESNSKSEHGAKVTNTNRGRYEFSRQDFVRIRESTDYKEMLRQRSNLPIYEYRDEILETIAENPVTVLCAETGAGKTTQCPQFLLEDAVMNGRAADTSIICTQPRRVAATSIAERVSEEICEKQVGGLVGYSVRLESRQSASTRLLFCTTGVILRRLVDDPTLQGCTHILVDEVHERQWQIDVLLISLRNLLKGPRPDLKVILMSATLDSELFCKFFGQAPLVSVPGRTFPVASYFLEDILESTGHIIEEGSRFSRRDAESNFQIATLSITTRGGEKRKETVTLNSETQVELSLDYIGYSHSTRRSMDLVDETVINYDLIEDVLYSILVDDSSTKSNHLVPPEGADLLEGAVLIFLPGKGEIRSLMYQLQGSRIFGKPDRFDIIPMHSSLSSFDQRRAFRKPPKGVRKIILSTNICETSISITDVVCVIDTGRCRELQHDKRTSTPRLVSTWCSRASTKQRAGRAGRVQPGLCLKLFSSRTESLFMKERSEPELKRIPLEEVCLNILASGMTQARISCRHFLCQAPQPPPTDAVDAALKRLSDIGAVTLPQLDGRSEALTPLGRLLGRLPVDAMVGKMLIFSALFKCIDPIFTIAATLSASQSIFTTASIHNNNQVEKAAHASFQHPNSDFMTFVNIFEAFQKAEVAGKARKFCQKKCLNFNALREIKEARQLYFELVCNIRLLERERVSDHRNGKEKGYVLSSSPCNVNGKNEAVIHSVVFSGLYPNLAQILPNNSIQGPQRALLIQRNENLEIHSSSANSKISQHRRPSMWIAFHEKFATGNKKRSSVVSTTCFVHPFSIMLFGGSSLEILYLERKVRIDGWIELEAAAKTGVTFREVRNHVNWLLKAFIEQGVNGPSSSTAAATSTPLESKVSVAVDAIVRLFTDS